MRVSPSAVGIQPGKDRLNLEASPARGQCILAILWKSGDERCCFQVHKIFIAHFTFAPPIVNKTQTGYFDFQKLPVHSHRFSFGTPHTNEFIREMANQQYPKLVNKQFNSPINLYSEASVREVIERESQLLSNGAIGWEFLFKGFWLRNFLPANCFILELIKISIVCIF